MTQTMAEFNDAFIEADNCEDWGAAYELAERASEQHPRDAHAWAMRARAHLKRGDEDASAQDVQQALKRDPQCALALATQSVLLDNNGRSREAMELLNRAIASGAPNANLLIARGWQLRQAGQLEAALNDFQQAMRLAPNDQRATTNSAALLGDLGRNHEAIALWNEAGRAAPHNGMLGYNAGTSLLQLGEYQLAIAHLDRARQLLGPTNAVQMNRALTLQYLDRHQEAIDEWLDLLKREPEWDWVLSGLGRSYHHLGDAANAKRYFTRMDTVNGDLEGTIAYGWLLFNRSTGKELLKLVEPHARKPNAPPEIVRMMGMAKRWLGQYDEAREWMEQNIAAHEDYAPSHGDLAVVLQENFQENEAALQHVQVAIALDPQSTYFRSIHESLVKEMNAPKKSGWLKRMFGG